VCSIGSADALSMERWRQGAKHVRAPDLTTAFKGMIRILRGLGVDLVAVCERRTHTVEEGRHFVRRKMTKSQPGLG
jgi:hypothetical protein